MNLIRLFQHILLSAVGLTLVMISKSVAHSTLGLETLRRSSNGYRSRLASVQRDILSSLGMSDAPRISPDNTGIPDVALQEMISDQLRPNRNQDADEDEPHFMAGSSKLLLIAKKVQTVGFGETIQFVISAENRNTSISKVKLFYHINSADITMHEGSESEKMILRLSLLTDEYGNGTVNYELIQTMRISKHLVGWHSQDVQASLIRYMMSRSELSANVTLNFNLKCLNCIYKPFPTVITKHNVPFLKIDGRRRVRRTATPRRESQSSCQVHDLIVDFRALGWNWVLYPQNYTANYCAGSCRNPDAGRRQRIGSNSQIISAMLNNLHSEAASSCCVPDEVQALPILYEESGNIQRSDTTIRKIISCKCT